MEAISDTITLTERIQAVPVARPLYADDIMVGGLIVCGLVLAAVMADRKGFLPRLLKGFFLPRENAVENVRTTNVLYMRIGMYIVTFASAGLLLTIYTMGKSIGISNDGVLWLLSTAAVVLFHLLRVLLFVLTDRIFLDSFTLSAWEHSYSNWAILAGIPLYILAVMAIFFNLAPSTVLWLLGATFILIEICLLYKAFHIFSGKKYGILQLFVYLCTLELIPLLVAAKALVLFV